MKSPCLSPMHASFFVLGIDGRKTASWSAAEERASRMCRSCLLIDHKALTRVCFLLALFRSQHPSISMLRQNENAVDPAIIWQRLQHRVLMINVLLAGRVRKQNHFHPQYVSPILSSVSSRNIIYYNRRQRLVVKVTIRNRKITSLRRTKRPKLWM
jgi:hypothetical protein